MYILCSLFLTLARKMFQTKLITMIAIDTRKEAPSSITIRVIEKMS